MTVDGDKVWTQIFGKILIVYDECVPSGVKQSSNAVDAESVEAIIHIGLGIAWIIIRGVIMATQHFIAFVWPAHCFDCKHSIYSQSDKKTFNGGIFTLGDDGSIVVAGDQGVRSGAGVQCFECLA